MGNLRSLTKAVGKKDRERAQEAVKSERWEQFKAGRDKALAGTADWGSVSAESIARVVQLLCNEGVSVTFGMWQDGALMVVTLFYNGERERLTATNSEDMESMLDDVISVLQEAP